MKNSLEVKIFRDIEKNSMCKNPENMESRVLRIQAWNLNLIQNLLEDSCNLGEVWGAV